MNGVLNECISVNEFRHIMYRNYINLETEAQRTNFIITGPRIDDLKPIYVITW